MAGRGTPVIADGKLFGLGYDGKGETLQEVRDANARSAADAWWRAGRGIMRSSGCG